MYCCPIFLALRLSLFKHTETHPCLLCFTGYNYCEIKQNLFFYNEAFLGNNHNQ